MPVKIFFSYAHEDELLLDNLKKHLRPLEREGLVEFWYDRDISAGSEWEQDITKHLNEAQVILLLVSPDFIDSEYCYNIEMKRAMERHNRREARVIPIILRHVYWQVEPLNKLQALPTDAKPVIDRYWHDQDEAFFDVTEGLRNVIRKFFPGYNSYSYTRQGWPPLEASKNEFVISNQLFSHNLKRLCPACIEEFYPGDCQVISQITGEVLKPAPLDWMAKQLAHRNPEHLTSPRYLNKRASRQCPNPNCGYPLPYNIELAENISIAIVGDINSGKSTYIASVAHEIKERWVKENSKFVRATCLTLDVENEFAEMFHHKKVLEPTQPARSLFHNRPLIYELTFIKYSGQPAKRVNLILYDGSGEDQTWADRLKYYARYILTANAIVFLIDPFLLPEITNLLPEEMRPRMLSNLRRAYEILNSTIEIIKSYHGSKAKEHLKSIPFALMLSKSDLFKRLV